MDTEIKPWLDISKKDNPSKENQANLAQAILALANHGGGRVLIGFKEANGQWQPAPLPDAGLLNYYNQDYINGIVQHFAEPPFHCAVHLVPHSETGATHPVVVVPGGHRVPIRSKADGCNGKHVKMNTYYIRRPGPKSEPIQTAQEWDALINRCVRMAHDDLISDFRVLLYGIERPESEQNELENWTTESLDRFSELRQGLINDGKKDPCELGYWWFAYRIQDGFTQPTAGEMLDKMRNVRHYTGWPVWSVRNPRALRPYNGLIECWPPNLSGQTFFHFWLASPKGLFFLLRNYDDDINPDRVHPGTTLDAILPIWRIGECLLHAEEMSRLLEAPSGSVSVQVCWTGLAQRRLGEWTTSTKFMLPPFVYQCHSPSVQSPPVEIQADQIGSKLPELTELLLKPLYEAFDFFKMPMNVIVEVLKRLRQGRF